MTTEQPASGDNVNPCFACLERSLDCFVCSSLTLHQKARTPKHDFLISPLLSNFHFKRKDNEVKKYKAWEKLKASGGNC